MVIRNTNFNEFQRTYLFVDIDTRRKEYQKKHPDASIISLGIGDTTEAIPEPVIKGFLDRVTKLSNRNTYTGYPEYNGSYELRKLILDTFYKNINLTPDEIFISDGSKPDLARLQLLFGSDTTIAVQDPVYPVYVDTSVMSGKAGKYKDGRYTNIVYMPCTHENNFFPNLNNLKRTDIIYFCSPNNPTGAVATKQQLEELVKFAIKNQSIIIFDSAYSVFISDADLPKSIYEIKGAENVAFETSSFSKMVGFTGVRLGWTICPKSLKYSDGSQVLPDWARIMGTCFNGPSNLAESGGIAALQPEGLKAMQELVDYYKENIRKIKSVMISCGFECYGGVNSPYVWIRVPNIDVWDLFQELLEKANVITTPGVGFGQEGKHFLRISGFAHKEDVDEAVIRLSKALKKN